MSHAGDFFTSDYVEKLQVKLRESERPEIAGEVTNLHTRSYARYKRAHRLNELLARFTSVPGRRHLAGSMPPVELTSLYQGYGTHFVYIFVGTPRQRQSMIIDTGSHITAFPCVGCAQCGTHTDKYFDPRASTTVRPEQCAWCLGFQVFRS